MAVLHLRIKARSMVNGDHIRFNGQTISCRRVKEIVRLRWISPPSKQNLLRKKRTPKSRLHVIDHDTRQIYADGDEIMKNKTVVIVRLPDYMEIKSVNASFQLVLVEKKKK
mgnify:CR=1 FL=1